MKSSFIEAARTVKAVIAQLFAGQPWRRLLIVGFLLTIGVVYALYALAFLALDKIQQRRKP